MAGRPLIAWCLSAFAACESVGRAVIAAPAGREADFAALVPQGLEVEIVAGGTTRAESVAASLAAAERPGDGPIERPPGRSPELVVVHDAARPLVTAELIDACVATLAARADADAVIAAAPLADTVKRTDEPRPATREPERVPTVAKTESRDYLWGAQTPQVFRAQALRAALAGDARRVAAATDEAMLIEAAGGKVLIEPAPASNLKVTTPDDLRIAALLLGER